MELFTAFDRAVASTADVVKATPADQMSAPNAGAVLSMLTVTASDADVLPA